MPCLGGDYQAQLSVREVYAVEGTSHGDAGPPGETAGLLMFAALYVFALWATKRDPEMLRILLSSSRFRTRYDALKHEPFTIEVRRC